MVVLKQLIFNSFYFGAGVVVSKKLICKSFTLDGCGGPERTHFLTVCNLGGCGGIEKLILTFYTWEDVVVLKEIIFNSFYFGRAWWS